MNDGDSITLLPVLPAFSPASTASRTPRYLEETQYACFTRNVRVGAKDLLILALPLQAIALDARPIVHQPLVKESPAGVRHHDASVLSRAHCQSECREHEMRELQVGV